MKFLLLFFFLICYFFTFSQKTDDSEEFEVKIHFTPDSSKIIYQRFKHQNLINYIYQDKTGVIEEKGQYDTLETPVGKWYSYNKFGRLLKVENYETSKWEVYDKTQYPYKKYLDFMKKCADNYVTRAFGQSFFANHIKWNFNSSTVYFSDNNGKNWTDSFLEKPEYFLLKYNILSEKDEVYNDMIEFFLDTSGNLFFPDSVYDNVKGFERTDFKDFKISKTEAIRKAKLYGLTDSQKTEGFLYWEYFDSIKVNQYNGHYRYYLIAKITGNDIPNNNDSQVVDKFTVYVFNPWTADFIEKRKMKSIRILHQDSGFISGLLPDR
jgi:hypothetical protein